MNIKETPIRAKRIDPARTLVAVFCFASMLGAAMAWVESDKGDKGDEFGRTFGAD